VERALRERPLYVESSKYATQLDEYLPYFPAERIHVLTTDQLKADRAGTLARLYEFVGVEPGFVPPNLERERGHTTDKRVRRPLARALREQPWYRAAVQRLPASVRDRGRRLATKPIDVDASRLSPELDAELRAVFAPEVARLRAFLGPDFDGWGLA
jgi:hypothetical protein